MDIQKPLISSTTNNNDEVDADYNYSRSNYYELVDYGKEAIEDMLELAKETQHPRSFEVLGKLIKDVSDVNDRIIKLQKTKVDIRQLDSRDASESVGSITNNNLFVGSTTDLQRILLNESIDNKDSVIGTVEK